LWVLINLKRLPSCVFEAIAKTFMLDDVVVITVVMAAAIQFLIGIL